MGRDRELKKLSVTALLVGAFIVYSFVHAHSSDAVLAPKSSSSAVTTVTTSVPTAAGAPPDASRTPTIARTPSQAGVATATSAVSGRYKDGSYTGSAADAQWGIIQVQAVILGGQITDVQFLQYPNHRSRSVRINNAADPKLKSEAIQAQSAKVHIVTGATDSSEAFIQSLADALSQAQP